MTPRAGKEGTVGALLNEWLDHAKPSFSPTTVATTRMYIDDPVVPAIGSMPTAKLTPRVPMKELALPSPDQVVLLFRLAQESDPDLATFVVLAASSGARRGELLALASTA